LSGRTVADGIAKKFPTVPIGFQRLGAQSMARYSSAIWQPGNDAGNYLGGPRRIVWHTTEGDTAAEAVGHYRRKNSWPHFTVGEDHVYQHVDTSVAARTLENHPGGVETNRWHAVQIELVGHAALAKSSEVLKRAARLARWIERIHGVVQVWPNGYPLLPVNGGDPGGHNRDANTWANQGGHYGHCHVPENRHWDPGMIDIDALMATEPPVGDFPDPPRDFRYA
jgi:hypothetical protein